MSSIHMLMSSFIMSSLCFTDCIWIEGVGAGWASATSMATSGADCWMGSRNAMEERLSRFVPGRWDTYLEPSRSAFGLHRAGSSVPQSSQPHPEGSNGRNAAWRLCILNSAEIWNVSILNKYQMHLACAWLPRPKEKHLSGLRSVIQKSVPGFDS